MSNAKINLRKGINRDTRQNIIVLAALVVVMAFFGIRSPYFLKPANLVALLAAAVPLGLIGIAESVCLLTGAFDMAVGMVASLGGVIVTMLISEAGYATYVAYAIALVFGILSGLVAGVSVGYLKMPAWIATFALMNIWRGVIYILTNGDAIRMTKFKEFKWLGQHKIFGTDVTPAIVILILAFVAIYFVLRLTKFGRDLHVVGGNPEAAKNVGLRVELCQTLAFTISGFLSALAGVLFASRSGSGQPVIGEMYAMQAIAGAVVGGTSMAGGKTNPAMTFVGIMFVVCLQNGLTMIQVPAFYQHIATGAILVLAILVQTERPK